MGGSEGLPASWPGPPICHDAFIRATKSPPGDVTTLEGGVGCSLAPGEGCLSHSPCQVSWQHCPRAEGHCSSSLRRSLLHLHCFLNSFPPGVSQGR